MEILTDPVFLKAVERIIIIIGAIIFGLLGYKLFIAGIKSADARFEAKSKSYEFIISGKAPGLFFMFFSSIILVVSLNTGKATRETIATEKEIPPLQKHNIKKEMEQEVMRETNVERVSAQPQKAPGKMEGLTELSKELDVLRKKTELKQKNENRELLNNVDSIEN